MGIYISKLGIQALVVSQIVMLCTATPTIAQSISTVDTDAHTRESGDNGLNTIPPYARQEFLIYPNSQ
ncbi:hypothetical protein DSO57_1035300 [Entomophthora muscae]|uniref:Uncharacterized protein n=1 Tax=Entomophthora muscae TaxID=34485 RepID=A0ACC2U8L1_9FUNG|nr:hypothetical protein DSO57_1035300 [Entomophthora muscae]